MKYDGVLDIATGFGATSKKWKNKKTTWSDLVSKLKESVKTDETLGEFLSANKEDQLKIKDVGGYVGGYLRGGRRKQDSVVHRQILTLDIDFASASFWDNLTMWFSNAAVLHSTHKHSDESPRYRLVMPLDRETPPDEYVAVSRAIAGILGIDLFDDTTFETHRLMFWPSTPVSEEYEVHVQDGPWINVDEVLGTYQDWTDSSLWPLSSRKKDIVKNATTKQEDPEIKKGVVGAFCRAYSIREAIETFLNDAYTPSTVEDRYTYNKGTAASGLVIYDDKFAFSHHGTDPGSGKLCNAFDLVRLHKFGDLDPQPDGPTHRLKSYKSMEELARSDDNVKKIVATETFKSAASDFEDSFQDIENEDLSWTKKLEIDGRGKYLSSSNNLNAIFANDPRLKGLFKHNRFDNKSYLCKSPPWRKVLEGLAPLKDVDYAGIRNYIETVYEISGKLKIEDNMHLELEKSAYHPVTEYLSSLNWDHTPRVESLFCDYLGAESNLYTREAAKKMMVGAVARVFEPGVKFDLVVTLIGRQGSGKSTLVDALGKGWYSDTFTTVTGKEAFEQLQGFWIIEVAELAGMKKAEVETIKHFITKRVDSFRGAYKRVSEGYPRQCIFVGTTNRKDFLRDATGNRRFLPIDLEVQESTKNVFKIPEREIDQLWAEAVLMYKAGEPLYLNAEVSALAVREQRNHSESDERTGLIVDYLNTRIPADWHEMDLYKRRSYIHDEVSEHTGAFRDKVCVAEIWCECLCKDKQDMDRYKTRELNEIVRSLEGWEPSRSTRSFKPYGVQKYYKRTLL